MKLARAANFAIFPGFAQFYRPARTGRSNLRDADAQVPLALPRRSGAQLLPAARLLAPSIQQ